MRHPPCTWPAPVPSWALHRWGQGTEPQAEPEVATGDGETGDRDGDGDRDMVQGYRVKGGRKAGNGKGGRVIGDR